MVLPVRPLIDALAEFGIAGHVEPDYPGVWVDRDHPRKIAAIGVRLAHGRTMHGFALNVHPDMRYMRDYIVPCGIGDKPVTSLAEEGVIVDMQEVVDVVARHAAEAWGQVEPVIERQDVAWKHRLEDLAPFSRGEPVGSRATARLQQAGVTEGLAIATRKPDCATRRQ